MNQGGGYRGVYPYIPHYGFVMLPRDVRLAARPNACFDRRLPGCFTGTLLLHFVTEQPLHVGAGFKRLEGGKVVRAAMRVGKTLIVPGSSWKGCVRARYEAITFSCLAAPPRSARIRSSTGIEFAAFAEGVLKRANFETCRIRHFDPEKTPLCPACALFGAQGLRSRLSFSDLTLEKPAEVALAYMPDQFAPNLHHLGKSVRKSLARGDGKEMFEVTSVSGRKFALTPAEYQHTPTAFAPGMEPAQKPGVGALGPSQRVEVIPRGTVLKGRLSLINVSPAELGGLLTALGVAPASKLKLGAGKGLGFGRLRLQRVVASLRDAQGRLHDLEVEKLRTAFQTSEDCFGSGLEQLVKYHQGEV